MRFFLIILAMIAGVASATPALAHTVLIATDPIDGAILPETPAALSLTFNEVVDPTSLRLAFPDGSVVEQTDIVTNGRTIVVRLDPLGEGTHLLSWRVVSADGHPVGGSLLFSVGSASGVAAAAVSGDPLLRPLIWAVRVVLYLALFFGVAGAFFVGVVANPEAVSPRLRRILRGAMLAGLVAAPLAFALNGVDLLGGRVGGIVDPVTWKAALESSYTGTVVAALVALAAGLVSLGAPALRGPAAVVALLSVGAAFALSGHASRAPPEAVSWLVVFVHTVAVAFWVGALIPLAGTLRDPRRAAQETLARFSELIPHPIAALLVAGAVLAYLQLRQPSDLWTTDYGRLLLAKLILVAALLAIALVNRRRLTPALRKDRAKGARLLRRSIVAEVVLVTIVFGVVAGWRFTPPPRAIAAPAAPAASGESVLPFFTHVHGTEIAADLEVTPATVGPVSIEVTLYSEGLEPLVAEEVALALFQDELGLGPIEVDAEPTETGWVAEGVTVPVAGVWRVEITARISTFDQRSTFGRVPITDPRQPSP